MATVQSWDMAEMAIGDPMESDSVSDHPRVDPPSSRLLRQRSAGSALPLPSSKAASVARFPRTPRRPGTAAVAAGASTYVIRAPHLTR